MNIIKRLTPILCTIISILLMSAVATARSRPSSQGDDELMESAVASSYSQEAEASEGEGEEEEEYEYEEEELKLPRAYQRMYYSFGIGGSYWPRRDGVDIKGNVGAYSCFEYRPSRIISIGIDTYYGWLVGGGTQYWSAFNPGVKIFPMMYKNPRFEPFIFIGGHAFDGAYGDSSRGTVGMGQGGFGGFGFRWYSEAVMIGLEAFVRASVLYMERPKPASGRGLAIPIFMFVGAVY